MIDIKQFVSICETALPSIGFGLKSCRPGELTDKEKELLCYSYETGEFCFFSGHEMPSSWIRAGNKDFRDKENPVFSAEYLRAFKVLCESGYIKYLGGRYFMLSSLGLKTAKRLKITNNKK
jgi:hypothetical protein